VSRPAPTLLLWAIFLALHTVVAVAFFDLNGPETAALLAGATGIAALGAAFIAVRRGAVDPDVPRALPDLSPSTALLGVAIALLALGAALGFWLAYIGAGTALFGAAGLMREVAAERAATRTAAPRAEEER
jgi:hypothetical protein